MKNLTIKMLLALVAICSVNDISAARPKCRGNQDCDPTSNMECVFTSADEIGPFGACYDANDPRNPNNIALAQNQNGNQNNQNQG